MTRKVIAFAGYAGSGKDYQCQQLVKQGDYKKIAFADALRKIAFANLGLAIEKAPQNYEWMKANPCISVTLKDGTSNSISLRKFLEFMGTEGIRYYDNDFWVKCLLKEIDKLDSDINVCISDLRFHNEYQLLKDFCNRKGYEFKLIFCDYHSNRYEEFNTHASACLANFLKDIGYKDLDIVKEEDMEIYVTSMTELKF